MCIGTATFTTTMRVLALAFVVGTGISAQQTEFVQAQQANSAALRAYTWKSRTELKLKGESRNVVLEQVRYDIDGRLQKTQIGGVAESQEPRAGRGRAGAPIRQRVVARKQEEVKELMKDLASLAGSYAHLPPDRLQSLAKGATRGGGQGIETGSVRIQGRNVLTFGDEVIIWLDPMTSMIRRVEVVTALEAKPVTVVTDYRSLDNGLTYQARTILRYPEQAVELIVENFEYQHVGASR